MIACEPYDALLSRGFDASSYTAKAVSEEGGGDEDTYRDVIDLPSEDEETADAEYEHFSSDIDSCDDERYFTSCKHVEGTAALGAPSVKVISGTERDLARRRDSRMTSTSRPPSMVACGATARLGKVFSLVVSYYSTDC